MGREVRRVPADWQHPKQWRTGWTDGRSVEEFKPLFPGERYQPAVDEWDEECAKWKSGWRPEHCDEPHYRAMAYEQWSGQRPHRDNYMPNWPAEQRTHLMMYEDTSEGTPISPAFETPEELARWLTDNGASAFGSSTGSYEGWLRVATGGLAPSFAAGFQRGFSSAGISKDALLESALQMHEALQSVWLVMGDLAIVRSDHRQASEIRQKLWSAEFDEALARVRLAMMAWAKVLR